MLAHQQPCSLITLRVKAVMAAKARGENPYPHKFATTIQLPAYVAKYKDLEAGEQLTDTEVRLAGRQLRGRAAATSPGLVRMPVPLGIIDATACTRPHPLPRFSLPGRVERKAASGAKLVFIDLRSAGSKVQVMCDARCARGLMGCSMECESRLAGRQCGDKEHLGRSR